ncbi:MAG: secretin and TonB N-terminal domain-containing protein [Spirulinaceae cyanobacterium]
MKTYPETIKILAGVAMLLLAAQPARAVDGEIKELESSEQEVLATENEDLAALPLEVEEDVVVDEEVVVVNETPAAETTTVAQTPDPPQPIPILPESTPDVLVPNPDITIDGQPASPSGPIQPVAPAPPLLPRAVAPPVGDISISTIVPVPQVIDLGTGARIPRLVLREASVREVLSLLARTAGLNLVYSDEAEDSVTPIVSLDLQNESVQDTFNYILQLSGLKASRNDQTILVGGSLPDSARNIVTRTFRLNQVNAGDAATFLASQGAAVQILTQTDADITNRETGEVIGTRPLPAELTTLTAEQDEEGETTFLLRGLAIATDPRLNSITIIGPINEVEIATSFLVQLDARRRQVAINVKVIDVNLTSNDIFGTSFSFGINDTSFINQFGVGILSLGGSDTTTPSSANLPSTGIGTGLATIPGVSQFDVGRRFLAQLQAAVVSNNAKIITDPTLIVQEGQQAAVRLFQEVVTNIRTEQTIAGGAITTTITVEKEPAGLILGIEVDRIDDNGFVSFTVNPEITAIGDTQNIQAAGISNTIALLSERSLSSGLVRLRDGQTLVLTGIIQEQERVVTSKVPILGDLPIIGSLFRSTDRDNTRAEVIVLVTPRIMDDSQPYNDFNYSYIPNSDVRQRLQGENAIPNIPQ